MNRREAIQRVAMILGGSVIGANLFLQGCTQKASKAVDKLFEESNISLLGDLADAILPRTTTPGAKEAGVGSFIPVMIRDCYSEPYQEVFLKGFSTLDQRANELKGNSFLNLDAAERLELVIFLDKEAKSYDKKQSEEQKEIRKQNKVKQNELYRFVENTPPHWFTLFKQLTLLGFFNSELGVTQALRYVKIPVKYDGDYPYRAGDKAFA